MNFMNRFSLASIFSLVSLFGCSDHAHEHERQSGDGRHQHHAPLGGALVVLGEPERGHNLEILLDEQDRLSVYLLGPHAETYVRIKQPHIQLNLSDRNGTTDSLKLHAVNDPATGETIGDSSHFRSNHGISKRLPILGVLGSIAVGATEYNGTKITFSGNPHPPGKNEH